MLVSKVDKTRDVTSAGVMSLGIVSVKVSSGANPETDDFCKHTNKDTHQDGAARPFVLVGIMAREFAKQFYSSAAWQSCRNEYAKQARYLCEHCLKKGIYRPGVIVHHVEELTPENIHRPEIALSFENLELLCRECHAEEHNEHGKGRRYFFGENGEIILK